MSEYTRGWYWVKVTSTSEWEPMFHTNTGWLGWEPLKVGPRITPPEDQ